MKSDRSHLSGHRQFHLSISATQTDLFWKPCSARRQRSWLNSLSISQLVSLSPGYGCNDRRFCKAFELRLSCAVFGLKPNQVVVRILRVQLVSSFLLRLLAR